MYLESAFRKSVPKTMQTVSVQEFKKYYVCSDNSLRIARYRAAMLACVTLRMRDNEAEKISNIFFHGVLFKFEIF